MTHHRLVAVAGIKLQVDLLVHSSLTLLVVVLAAKRHVVGWVGISYFDKVKAGICKGMPVRTLTQQDKNLNSMPIKASARLYIRSAMLLAVLFLRPNTSQSCANNCILKYILNKIYPQ